jgi:hypothetical protein
MKEIYQSLYDGGKYGNASLGRCPGVRMFELYRDWVSGTIFDWGCGNGATVEYLIENGYDANGMDQVKSIFCQGDITDIWDYNCDTALCLDVLEHIPCEKLGTVFRNIMRSKRQILSVNNKSCIKLGNELHITLMSFEEWEKEISKHTAINKKIKYDENTMIYLCGT